MRHLAVVALCLALCGCSSGLLSFGEADSDAMPAAEAVTPVPVAQPVAANDQFCRAVATQDALGHGFDQATEQKVAARSYQQCVSIYTR